MVGFGVGLDLDYGTAQRMCVRRGYLRGDQGLGYNGKPVRNDDSAAHVHQEPGALTES